MVMVLVLLTVLSLALGALFANAGANLTTSTVITGRNNKVHAADGAVESAIQQLRANSTLCPAPVPGPPTTMRVDGRPPSASQPDLKINGVAVTLTCRTTAGLATSVSRWALVTTDTAPGDISLASVPPSGTSRMVTDGPVYNAGGVKLQSRVAIGSGLYQRLPACTGSESSPPGFIGPWTCTTAPVPTLDPTLPPFDGAAAPPIVLAAGCTIFQPGKYTAITLGAHNYFVSGVYYFEDTHVDLAQDGVLDLVGGQPAPGETPVIGSGGPCAGVTDKLVGRDNGSGVELILGGSSTIDLGSKDMELFSRLPGTEPEGAAGVSVRSVPFGDAHYKQSSIVAPDEVFDMQEFTNAHLAIHGMVYVPNERVYLFATNLGAADLLGGLVCSGLSIGPNSGASSGRVISAPTASPAPPAPQARYVVITAVAQPSGSESPVASTAVVAIGNDPARTVTVQSWITDNP